jgi:hypothetical protein
MKAVLDEMNGEVAVFVLDEVKEIFHEAKADLPADTKVGDVFEVQVRQDGQYELGQKLSEERQRRENSIRAKREQLLKRSQNKE